MLIKMDLLERIKKGEVTHVYRRWKRAAAKEGGRQRTALGEFLIHSVETLDAVCTEDATKAGMTLEALQASLEGRDGTLYRIGLCYDRPDPRVTLRSDLSGLDDVVAKLRKKDARGEPWTQSYLTLLAENPEVRAQDLADQQGLDKPVFKRRVRQLKELGLTISLSPGYRLSPRGEAVLELLRMG